MTDNPDTSAKRPVNPTTQRVLESLGRRKRKQVILQGLGIGWRSTWEVEGDIAAGTLVPVLEDFAAPPNGIYAVLPQRKHLPLRVRLWIDFLKHHYGDPAYWRAAVAAS